MATSSSIRRPTGFTLIELLITVAVLCFLLLIALPSYREQVARTRRTEARTQLMQAAQFMQRFYTANDSFAFDRSGGAVADAMPQPFRQSPPDSGALYLLSIPAGDLTASRFELRMEPVPDGPMAADKCGSFTITSQGRRGVLVNGVEGSSSLVATCWR